MTSPRPRAIPRENPALLDTREEILALLKPGPADPASRRIQGEGLFLSRELHPRLVARSCDQPRIPGRATISPLPITYYRKAGTRRSMPTSCSIACKYICR